MFQRDNDRICGVYSLISSVTIPISQPHEKAEVAGLCGSVDCFKSRLWSQSLLLVLRFGLSGSFSFVPCFCCHRMAIQFAEESRVFTLIDYIPTPMCGEPQIHVDNELSLVNLPQAVILVILS